MYKRPHHQRILRLLSCFNAPLLAQTNCYFGGGTAIVLLLDEYRESVDIDFLCASKEGYRQLRNSINQNSLGGILNQPIRHLREVRADRYGIRTFLEVDSTPVKVEIVFEARISLDPAGEGPLPVPILSITDLFAEKLLANCDRGLDVATANRDAIDLAMMISRYGCIPDISWNKARDAYGHGVTEAFSNAVEKLRDYNYRNNCLKKMAMDESLSELVIQSLEKELESQI